MTRVPTALKILLDSLQHSHSWAKLSLWTGHICET